MNRIYKHNRLLQPVITKTGKKLNNFGDIEFLNKINHTHRIGMPSIIALYGSLGWYFNGTPHRINGRCFSEPNFYKLYNVVTKINIGNLVI